MKKLYFIICLFWLAGCSNFLEEYSQDQAYIQSDEDLDELLLGNAYFQRFGCNSWQYTGSSGEQYYAWVHISGDELQQLTIDPWIPSGPVWTAYGYFTWQYRVYQDPEGNGSWNEGGDFRKLYAHINACNMIMEETKAFEVDEDEGVQENIARIKGECHFLRGSYYFLLANFYGKPYDAATAATDPAVPIKVTPYVEDVFFQRNSMAEVYEQVEKDLLEAERLLKDIPQESLYQADVHAVRLMLSRMYLYMCNYEKAMEYASLVVEEGPALGDLNGFAGEQFLTPDLSEIIFSMGTNSLAENVAFTGGEPAGNDFSISSELYAAYDPTNSHDLRLQHYIVSENGYITYKKLQGGWSEKTDLGDVFLLRASEAYLNLAEAAACGGDETTARKALQALREKRIDQAYYNPAELDALSGADLVYFIREERRRELCLEGHRWFDLRRYRVAAQYPQEATIVHIQTNKTLNSALNIYETSWVRRFTLTTDDPAWVLPIPEEEIDKNTGMLNNPRNERNYETVNE